MIQTVIVLTAECFPVRHDFVDFGGLVHWEGLRVVHTVGFSFMGHRD